MSSLNSMSDFYHSVHDLESAMREAGYEEYACLLGNLWKGCYSTGSEFLDFVFNRIAMILKKNTCEPRKLESHLLEHIYVLQEYISKQRRKCSEQEIHTSELEAKGITIEELIDKGFHWAKNQPNEKDNEN